MIEGRRGIREETCKGLISNARCRIGCLMPNSPSFAMNIVNVQCSISTMSQPSLNVFLAKVKMI